jgi:hypothetical protein
MFSLKLTTILVLVVCGAVYSKNLPEVQPKDNTQREENIWNSEPKKFEANQEYVYRYDAQILTGVPLTSWLYSVSE